MLCMYYVMSRKILHTRPITIFRALILANSPKGEDAKLWALCNCDGCQATDGSLDDEYCIHPEGKEGNEQMMAQQDAKSTDTHLNYQSSPDIMTEVKVGTILGKYLLTEEIGRGGVGIVFQALHQSLNISVAVKLIRPEILDDEPDMYEQICSEARLLAQLNHPNVVRVWDFDDNQRMPYLVMEYVGGTTLLDLIYQSGQLGIEQAIRFTMQVADGLALAKQHDIIHRDVKPANMLISKDGTIKLTDLGQAAIHGASNFQDDKASSCRTGGTPAYMAPEQYSDPYTVDHRSDIYSLGVSLYQMLSGRLPFEVSTFTQMLLHHTKVEPTPLHELIPSLPLTISEIVSKMLAKKPEERYATYEDLMRDLRAVLHGDCKINPSRKRQINNHRTTDSPASHKISTDAEIQLSEASEAIQKPIKERESLSSPSQILKVAMIAKKNNRISLACQLMRDAVYVEPDNEVAWLMLARTTKDEDEAYRAYLQVIRINPENQPARIGLTQLQNH